MARHPISRPNKATDTITGALTAAHTKVPGSEPSSGVTTAAARDLGKGGAIDRLADGMISSAMRDAAQGMIVGSLDKAYGAIAGNTAFASPTLTSLLDATTHNRRVDAVMREALSMSAGIGGLSRSADLTVFDPAYRSPARDMLDQVGGVSRDLKPSNIRPRSGSSAAPSPTAIGSAKDIGRRVRAARQAMGMTQQRFADLAGVGRRFVIELEQGKPTLELGRVLAVLQAAGIKLGFLT